MCYVLYPSFSLIELHATYYGLVLDLQRTYHKIKQRSVHFHNGILYVCMHAHGCTHNVYCMYTVVVYTKPIRSYS